MVTHYQRLLDYIEPDRVHVLSRRPHSQERRQVARARAGEARLRLGPAGSGGRMSVMTLQESRPAGERYRAEFDARWSASDALVELRRAALERFVAAGFPTQRQEDWKYTNLRPPGSAHLRARYEHRGGARRARTALDRKRRHSHRARQRPLVPALSSVGAQLPGMTLLTLKQWSEHEPAAVAAFIAQTSRAQPSALEDLNLAFFEGRRGPRSHRGRVAGSTDLHRPPMERRLHTGHEQPARRRARRHQ
jgi:hypothetical protein